jgi:hypothetical protein
MAIYTPIYLDYDLIELILKSDAITVNLTEDQSGAISKELVLYYMCQAESYIYNTMFSNYVASPLMTKDGLPFATLADSSETKATYEGIINIMTNYAILTILNKVYSGGGTGNGEKQIKFATTVYNQSAQPYLPKHDNTESPVFKNVMRYLKPCDNASNRVPTPAGSPDIPSGLNEGLLALNNIPYFGTRTF